MIYSKYILIIIAITVWGVVNTQDTTKTSPKHGRHFIDLDGDGYNDNAPDHDGDGIPNGLDPDWKRGQGGRGKGRRLFYLNNTNTVMEDTLYQHIINGDTTIKVVAPDSLAMPSSGQRKKYRRPAR